jgi:hypothetical protein
MRNIWIFVSLLVIAVATILYLSQGTENETVHDLAGWRSSEYGYQQEQPPPYWIDVAESMSSKFQDFSPAGIWVIGVEENGDCNLQFPGDSESFDYITFADTDINGEYLDAFDQAGLRIWLQVEPASADVGTLINLVLRRYSNHTSIMGFGVDVEWLEPEKYQNGRPVTSAEASTWLAEIKMYNPEYKLFLKHWDFDKMPQTHLEDLVFISDSQEFDTYEEMMEDFENWGNHFSNEEVGFQYGYESDRHIWESFDDPAGKIGNDIIDRIPNTAELYWVDFTITDVFRP